MCWNIREISFDAMKKYIKQGVTGRKPTDTEQRCNRLGKR